MAGVGSDPAAERLLIAVDTALAAAEAELERESRGRALCGRGRGAPGGGPLAVRAAEGRVAALVEMRAELRQRLGAGEPADPDAVVGTVRARWMAELRQRRHTGGSPGGITLIEAGLDALDLLPRRSLVA